MPNRDGTMAHPGDVGAATGLGDMVPLSTRNEYVSGGKTAWEDQACFTRKPRSRRLHCRRLDAGLGVHVPFSLQGKSVTNAPSIHRPEAQRLDLPHHIVCRSSASNQLAQRARAAARSAESTNVIDTRIRCRSQIWIGAGLLPTTEPLEWACKGLRKARQHPARSRSILAAGTKRSRLFGSLSFAPDSAHCEEPWSRVDMSGAAGGERSEGTSRTHREARWHWSSSPCTVTRA